MISRSTIRDIQEALSKLEEERAAIAVRLTEIDKQADALRISFQYFMSLAEESPSEDSEPLQAKSVRNAVFEILRETNEPIYYRDFVGLLEKRGVIVRGIDPAKNVGAHLSNDARFKNVGKGMWGLTSWPDSNNRVRSLQPTEPPHNEHEVSVGTTQSVNEEPENAAAESLDVNVTLLAGTRATDIKALMGQQLLAQNDEGSASYPADIIPYRLVPDR